MSFGFSVGDILSAISVAGQYASAIQECPLEKESQQLHQDMRQLALTLDGLMEACKSTDLEYASQTALPANLLTLNSIVFIANFKVHMKDALDTKAMANRVLVSTGLVSASRKCNHLKGINASSWRSYSEGDMKSLSNDLWQRAKQCRLVLVCDVENGQILEEALRNDELLRGRVFAVTSFETHQHPGHPCQQNGPVCCSEEGPDLVLWSVIRLLEESKKQSFAKTFGNLELSCITLSCGEQSALDSVLHGANLGQTQAALRALHCVAYAFRALHVEELLEALAVLHDSASESIGLSGFRSSVQGQGELTKLMSEILEVRDNGLVFFRNSKLQQCIVTNQIASTEPFVWQDGHETMATICLQHLHGLGPETILKPWASTNRWLADRRGKSRLHGYATAFWHEHCRLAEDKSRYLPALLHRTIFSAIAVHRLDSKEHSLALRDKTTSGLWVSATYGLRTLCKTYLEMGADLNLVNNWHKHPLQLLAVTFRQQYVELFLGFGEEQVEAKDKLRALRQRACFETSKPEMNNPIQLQRAFHTCQRVDKGVNSGFCRPGFSSLQMATIYGRSDVLELFQEHLNFALPSLRKNGLHNASKAGRCDIHCKVSAVIPGNSRACESGKGLERKRTAPADCFADARHAFHSLSLAEMKASNGFHLSTKEHITTRWADSCLPEDQEWCFVTKDAVEWG